MKYLINVLLTTLVVIFANACSAVTIDGDTSFSTKAATTPTEATAAYKEVTVSKTERGIITDSAGKVQVLEPGTYRLAQDTKSLSIYSIADQIYTMEGIDSIETRSSDGQLMNMGATLVYHVLPDKVNRLAETFKPEQYVSGLIRPIARNIVWTVSTQFTYVDNMNTRQAQIEKEMGRQIGEQLRQFGIELVKFELFSPN